MKMQKSEETSFITSQES